MAKKKMEITTKSPNECSSRELSEFEALVLEGGEVIADGLRERIKRAKKLIFVKDTHINGVIYDPIDMFDVLEHSNVLNLYKK